MCLWYSKKPTLLVQITGVYDYTYEFCDWCTGEEGDFSRIWRTCERLANSKLQRVAVIGGEVRVLPESRLRFLLSRIASALGMPIEVYTKYSSVAHAGQLSDVLRRPCVKEIHEVELREKGSEGIDLLLHRVRGRPARKLIPSELADPADRRPTPLCSACRTLFVDSSGEVSVCPFFRVPLYPSGLEKYVAHRSLELKRIGGRSLLERRSLWLDGTEVTYPDISMLVLLYRTGALRPTSRIIGVSPSYVVKRLRRLSSAFGRPVVMGQRGGSQRGGISFTRAGKLLYTSVIRWLLSYPARSS